MTSNQLAFVLTDKDAGIQTSQRELIRRHCMRGKNKKPDSRRSRREARREARRAGVAATDVAATPLESSQAPKDEGFAVGTELPMLSKGLSKRQNVPIGHLRGLIKHDTVPFPIASDWALFPFVISIDTKSQAFLHKYMKQNPIRDPMFPFRAFGIHIDMGFDPTWCPQLLASDHLMLQAVLLLVSASEDLLTRHCLSGYTRRHLQRTLPLLNGRLSDTSDDERDMVLYVVSVLASTAIAFGDFASAEAHASGISSILTTKAGLFNVNRNPALQLAIDRLDFSSTLMTERWRSIHANGRWMTPAFPEEIKRRYELESMISAEFIRDGELAEVFETLQHTALLLNLHHACDTAVNGALFRDAMGYAQAVLAFHAQHDDYTDRVSECLGRGMTAFLAATYRLPGLYEHPCLAVSTDKLAACLDKSKDIIRMLPTEVQIWLVLVRHMSMRESSADLSLSDKSEEAPMGGMAWTELRRQAKQVMWFDAIHDDLGERAWKHIQAITDNN